MAWMQNQEEEKRGNKRKLEEIYRYRFERSSSSLCSSAVVKFRLRGFDPNMLPSIDALHDGLDSGEMDGTRRKLGRSIAC